MNFTIPIVMLILWFIILIYVCIQTVHLEPSCPQNPEISCADKYRIVISITPPTHLIYELNDGKTGETPLSVADVLTYVIELREASTPEVDKVNFIGRGGDVDTIPEALKDTDNLGSSCDRLLYHTHAILNSTRINNADGTSFLHFGESPTVTTNSHGVVLHSFILNYYGADSGNSWNENAAIRPGNYIHVKMYSLLESPTSSAPKVSQNETANGIHFNDILSFSEITPIPPTVTKMTLGLVVVDGGLAMLEGTQVIETPAIITEIKQAGSIELMLKVPSGTKENNLRNTPDVITVKEYTIESNCLRQVAGQTDYESTNPIDGKKVPKYDRVVGAVFEDKNTINPDYIDNSTEWNKKWLVTNFKKTDDEILSLRDDRYNIINNPVDQFFLSIIDRLLLNSDVGAIFIPSTVLLFERTTIDGDTQYQLQTHITTFTTQIPDEGFGNHNEIEYKDNISEYTQTSNEDNLRTSIGFVDNQRRLSCWRDVNNTTHSLHTDKNKYYGGYYDNLIAGITNKTRLKRLFTGHIYYKITLEAQ